MSATVQAPKISPPLQPVLPPDVRRPLSWGRLHGASPALLIAATAARYRGLVLAIAPDSQTALRLETELRVFGGPDLDILAFPDWETLPYDLFSPHQDILSQRLATLYRLPQRRRGVLVVPVATLMQRLAPRGYLDGYALLLKVGERLDLEPFRQRLEAAGYVCVSQVVERGEFAVRGAILDLFPMGGERPYRIELFDDEVESIRDFDPDTQLSVTKVEHAELLPAREFPLDKETVTRFRQAYRRQFEGDPQRGAIYREVSAGHAPGGIEYYLPLFFEQTATLFDYLPENTLAIRLEGADQALMAFQEQLMERYEQRRHDAERPLLPPPLLFLDAAQVESALARRLRIDLREAENAEVNYPTEPPPALPFEPRAPQPGAALQTFLAAFPGRVLMAAESAGRREALLDTLRGHGLQATVCEGWTEFLAREDLRLAVAVAPLEQGLLLTEPPLAVIAEPQLYGERARQRRRHGPSRDPDAIIRNLTDLDLGAPVVHEEHGIGRYAGLERLEVAGIDGEFVVVEYAGDDRLYVPVASLHLLSRYTGAAPENAPLHKLGSGQWEKARRKAAEQVSDAAAELLDLYARREARPGHAFALPEADYAVFAAAFPFEETPDQQVAIEAVIADLRSGRPMDRVVCGDVGFGKTEVAMRAAFVAVQDGRQVAVLAPTTLLAQQHYQNFLDRFADWPVRIELLSRFRSAKQQTETLKALADGGADILIGTHKLLQGSVKFKQLGLVVIDEEHRFGVRQKERLKALRSEVDILTLTATPIPRTLNMAMAGLRELSIIATPPAGRLAVKTFVSEWNKATIQEACQRELKRGGQIYFLHNEVETIQRMAAQVAELAPTARIAVAHGQMRERDLEQVMLDFYHRRCNLLVCTTIIESGIDVPSANTIVINRADKLGLAQLHQLRGRVGRSHHRAYAYLIVPNRKAMTTDAVKRIEAIESLEDLGAGFLLASHDLEIRGAGELLGEAQSGQIHEVGFTLYMDLLERAIQALKAGRVPELDRPLDHGPEIELQSPALIPDDYLPDVHSRLILYKRIASARDEEELRELQVEMIDRFGLLPAPVKTLFRVTGLKLRATPVGVKKIEAGPKGGRIVFGPAPKVDSAKLVRLIQSQSRVYKLDGKDKLRFIKDLPNAEARAAAVERLLEEIGAG
ncbi:transcription-repair coupling factor [Candidatus Competibacter phosphatis]|uniref:Transcription-repair-coupling factor n=1 Tax=Candidatus Competibacter phosphatis TaxID=221280 RepID=A0ABX1TJN1_9GAMM|nr:transcription-repair coupling factor [Candidatus Competibacter phosphatis]NMQ18378.1 transcription-repair coupling factor [Candidatus Competibacter phosphatis]